MNRCAPLLTASVGSDREPLARAVPLAAPRRSRRWALLALSAASVQPLAGCGGGRDDKKGGTPAPPPVATPQLQSIAVEPPSVVTGVGGTQAFVVRGRYSDGSTALLTAGVSWSSSAAAVVEVGASTGAAKALAVGSAVLTASVGSLSASARFGVTVPYASMAAGGGHGLGIRTDGSLWAWGLNRNGQVGDDTLSDRPAPVAIGTSKLWTQVVCGELHSLGLQSDGSLWAWGLNQNGQLGQGVFADLRKPTPVGTKKDWVRVAAGRFHSAAINKNGELFCWGRNADGQLGDGTFIDRPEPTLVPIPAAYKAAVEAAAEAAGRKLTLQWTDVAAGGDHTLARMNDGSLWSWGRAMEGQLGRVALPLGSTATPEQAAAGTALAQLPGRVRLLRVDGSEEPVSWTRFAAGGAHSLALRSTGELYGWGSNRFGQLGVVSSGDVVLPLRVGASGDWNAVAAGAEHSLALKLDGSLWAWGSNGEGQLGLGTQSNAAEPTPVVAARPWQRVVAGRFHGLALTTEGLLWGWGRSAEGQLGDGAASARVLAPVALS